MYTLSIKSEVVKPPKDYAQTITHLEIALDEAQYAIVRLAILKALHDAAQPPVAGWPQDEIQRMGKS